MKQILLVIAGLFFYTIGIYAQSSNNVLSEEEKKQGWVLLFNGRNLDGWTSVGKDTPPEKGWTVEGVVVDEWMSTGKDTPPEKVRTEGGIITVNKGGPQRGGDIITKEQFSEFDLYFEFKLTKAANSGVKYLFTRYEAGGWLGNEYQVLDDDFHPDAKEGRDGNRKTGTLYDMLPTGKKTMKPTGEWNSGRVVIKGSNVTHYLNGEEILSYDRKSKIYEDAWKLSKFSKTVPMFGTVEKGHILLQEHQDEVSFRNIKILDLSKK